MRQHGPFQPSDLQALGEFFATTDGVVSMREVHEGNRDPRVVGLRHDVDGNRGSLEAAVQFARWEAERGYRSTYFLLHTAPYWRNGDVFPAAETIAELGHEIGFHTDAIAEALVNGGDPNEMVHTALAELRDAGHDVIGVVGHGNGIAYNVPSDTGLHFGFANDEQFVECARPKCGAPDRVLRHNDRELKLDPRPLAEFGLEYEAIGLRQVRERGVIRTLPEQVYNTDSGCKWFYPFEQTIAEFEALTVGQLHLNAHPDWWPEAFALERA